MTPLARSLLIAIAMIPLFPPTQGGARPERPRLEDRIAELKTRTAALVASERVHLDALSPQQRLSAPPAIWRVPGAITAFKDCADCPRMMVIPAGEFTMGRRNPSRFAERRPSTGLPSRPRSRSANSQSPLANGMPA
jgi:formylglycine-generating enzyme required for sulfatase activity